MPNKSFSIYSSENFTVEERDQLFIEIAKSHLACIVKKDNKRAIIGCELFSFAESEAETLDILLSKVRQESKILRQSPPSVSIYINNEFCIPVPIFKFNKEIAAQYLNLAFGDDFVSNIYFEHLPVDPGIMNVYRVTKDLFNGLVQHFDKFKIHHTYSNIIRTHINKAEVVADELLTVHFYNTFIIVILMKNKQLQLIQSFGYDGPEDVLYYLLNITRQFGLHAGSLSVQISGMIDKDFKLYRELITYFKNVSVEYVNESNLALQVGEYPLHYFTPYFNLAI